MGKTVSKCCLLKPARPWTMPPYIPGVRDPRWSLCTKCARGTHTQGGFPKSAGSHVNPSVVVHWGRGLHRGLPREFTPPLRALPRTYRFTCAQAARPHWSREYPVGKEVGRTGERPIAKLDEGTRKNNFMAVRWLNQKLRWKKIDLILEKRKKNCT